MTRKIAFTMPKILVIDSYTFYCAGKNITTDLLHEKGAKNWNATKIGEIFCANESV